MSNSVNDFSFYYQKNLFGVPDGDHCSTISLYLNAFLIISSFSVSDVEYIIHESAGFQTLVDKRRNTKQSDFVIFSGILLHMPEFLTATTSIINTQDLYIIRELF